jgi:hypothetical protein
MALKLDPIRLLIADDVGIGKTIEACLIVRELLDRGEASRLAVLCPPHLAEQWQEELSEKFHIQAELVLASTAGRLERHCAPTESLFDVYPHTVVSMDFIKTDRRREEFAHAAPDLVVVDEAHTCAFGYEARGGRHQRHDLVKSLASKADRHLILVTATPHSGHEGAFRSLLGFLRPEFLDLPQDLSGTERKAERRRLAAHFVQRRRADIKDYLGSDTVFPARDDEGPLTEAAYKLSPAYRSLFDKVLAFAQETVRDTEGGPWRQRVRWWSALALLRSMASSPAAAAATLRNRAAVADAETPEQADEIGRRSVFDLDPADVSDATDIPPGADTEDTAEERPRNRRRLLAMAAEAHNLQGAEDAKLLGLVSRLGAILQDGYHPIVFCRFIPTADYVAEELRRRLPAGVTVAAVTSVLPPADREVRVLELGQSPRRVLVATDCLSEGVNLQWHFDAVVHYDLSWNPTRHEQREGRVDRYGQPSPKVRVLTYYGVDNQIDGLVLDVLLRKHKTIRNSLGVSVPVPVDTSAVIEAIVEGLLLKQQKSVGPGGAAQLIAPGLEDYLLPSKRDLYKEWDAAADRERRSRSLFAQEAIKVDEVARDVGEARRATGTATDVERFVVASVTAHHGVVQRVGSARATFRFDLRETPRALRDTLRAGEQFTASFELPVGDAVVYLPRTHSVVEGLSGYVMDSALDPLGQAVARRAGVVRTSAVTLRTTLLLVRYRYDLVTTGKHGERSQLAEECRLLGFTGPPEEAGWLGDRHTEALLDAQPSGNITPEQARDFIARVVEGYERLSPHVEDEARRRAVLLREAHERVRLGAGQRGTSRVEAQLPPDVLGVYIYLPAPAATGMGAGR